MSLPHTQSQDLGNIVWFEHINLEVTDLGASIVFYIEALGLTRDPYERTGPGVSWMNAGLQQLHILTKEGQDKGEVIEGHIALIVPSIEHVVKSLNAALQKYKSFHNYSYKFTIEELASKSTPSPFLHDMSRYINITCPWGNTFRVYENNEKTNYKGELGIPYVEILCNKGTAAKIGNFYHKYLGTPPAIVGHNKEDTMTYAIVTVGPKQVLIFKETEKRIEFSTYHFCIYIADFSGTYHKLAAKNLLYTTGKFEDKCDTFENALSYSQFRFNKIVDVDDTSQVLFVLEHEVRSLYHPYYMRPLVNRTGSIGIYCKQ